MAIDRLLRANRTVLVVPVIDGATEPLLISPTGVTCPLSAPTTAVLNPWVSVLTTTATGAGQGGNISCALVDDLSLGLADPDLDTELTICSIGTESSIQFYNVDWTMNGFRDASKADTGVFNLFTQLMCAPDIRYIAVDRFGVSSTTAMVVGDIVSLYEGFTDAPVDVKADRSNLKLAQSPIPTGLINMNYTLAA